MRVVRGCPPHGGAFAPEGRLLGEEKENGKPNKLEGLGKHAMHFVTGSGSLRERRYSRPEGNSTRPATPAAARCGGPGDAIFSKKAPPGHGWYHKTP